MIPIKQRMCGMRMQMAALLVGLITGILAVISLLHYSLIVLNYEYTYPEILYTWTMARNFNLSCWETFKEMNNSLNQLCHEDLWSAELPKKNESGGKYRRADNQLGHLPSVLQDLEKEKLQIFHEIRKPYFDIPWDENTTNLEVFRNKRAKPRNLPQNVRSRMPTGFRQLSSLKDVFGGLWRPLPRNLVMRAYDRTEINLTEVKEEDLKSAIQKECNNMAEEAMTNMNLLMNMARVFSIGRIEDQVFYTAMLFQVLGLCFNVLFLAANFSLLMGIVMMTSSWVMPWLCMFFPYVLFNLCYCWYEFMLYSEVKYGWTPLNCACYFLFFVLVLVLALFAFWIVWCFYWMLFSPEGYDAETNQICQLVVTGRTVRGATGPR